MYGVDRVDHKLTVTTDAPVVLVAVTIFAILSWWFMPAEAWLQKERIVHFIESDGVNETCVKDTK